MSDVRPAGSSRALGRRRQRLNALHSGAALSQTEGGAVHDRHICHFNVVHVRDKRHNNSIVELRVFHVNYKRRGEPGLTGIYNLRVK